VSRRHVGPDLGDKRIDPGEFLLAAQALEKGDANDLAGWPNDEPGR
jgi:hypothetical protein